MASLPDAEKLMRIQWVIDDLRQGDVDFGEAFDRIAAALVARVEGGPHEMPDIVPAVIETVI